MASKMAAASIQLTVLIVAFLLATTGSASSAASPPAKLPKVYLPKGFCIELTKKGIDLTPKIRSLIEQALEDAAPGVDMAQFGYRNLEFYKAKRVSGSKTIYLVFSIRGFHDVYMVYRADLDRGRLLSRSPYGSMHYPCPASVVDDGGA